MKFCEVPAVDSTKSLTSVLMFLTGGILILLEQNLIDIYPIEERNVLLILLAFGLILVIVGIWTFDKGFPNWFIRIQSSLSKYSISGWQFLCLILAVPVVFIVPFEAGSGAKMLNPWAAVLTWILAICLVVAGSWVQPAPLHWPSWRLVTLTLSLTITAFLLRAILADRIPILLNGDEGSSGLAAASFTNNTWNNIFITSWYGFPSFFFTIPAGFIGTLGRTIYALRIPSAIAGALTVTASFFVARAMFGKRAAWFSAIFLATFNFHIYFSRIGLNNIWDGLWYVVTIGAFWYGWEKDRRNAYVLAGLSLGISQYFYPSSHTLIILLLLWLIFAAIFDRSRLKRSWVNLVITIIVATIVAEPLIWHYIKYPDTFFEPMNRVGLSLAWLNQQVINTGTPAWKIVLNQIALAFGSFTYDHLQAWYTPDTPLLRPLSAALFLIGIVLVFLRKQKWHIIPLMLWLFAFVAIGGFSESTPAAQRYVAAAPVCALLIGYGLSESAGLVEKVFFGRKRWINIISFTLIAILALDELNFYFRVYTPHSSISLARSNGMIAQTLADSLETKAKDTEVLFFGFPSMGFYSIPSIQFLVPAIRGFDINEQWPPIKKPVISSNHLLFVFLPNNIDQIPKVKSDYPVGLLTSVPAADGELLYETYEVTISP
jgi:4-amino-4-deoxy-L-arabinose transferase-like glycosyltransferase